MQIKTDNSIIYISDDSEIAKKIKNGDEFKVVKNKVKFTGKNFNIKKIVEDFEKRIKALETKLK